jgi:hypothetical protein
MSLPRIEAYSFGSMTIDGRGYRSDLIIHPDGAIEEDWWRERGHNLTMHDIEKVLRDRPQVLIIGTGASGMMRISPGLHDECSQRGVTLEAYGTADAADRYNALAKAGTSVAAGFHLTC